jgi:DEAD/DEAH box helicase domain-containing protein
LIVIDVETQNFFSAVNDEGVLNLPDLKISFAGAYESTKGEYLSFWEKDLSKLEELLRCADLVVGYNVWGFDYGVLSSYFSVDLWTFPTIDLMVAMKKVIGFRPKLDNLAKANFSAGKIGKGADAIEYWQNGELEKLEKYCLEDVRLTYEVWKLGAETGRVKYFDQSGFLKETAVDWKNGFQQKVDESVQGRLL